MSGKAWLLTAAGLDGLAAILHLACIVGGPDWYRFFGAGEEFARLAQRGDPTPAIASASIAAALALFAAYALSGAGVIGRLPLLPLVLAGIALIFIARGLAYPVLPALMPGRSATFWAWSSAIVLALGLIHAIGLAYAWPRLSR